MASINQRKQQTKGAVCIHHEDIACSTLFSHPDTNQGHYEPHPLSMNSDWLLPNDFLCWHCAHAFETVPVYIPQGLRGGEPNKPIFEVFGNFCSLSCAKAYILDHQHFDSDKQVMLLNKLAVDIYNTQLPIRHAPPRETLHVFGGMFTIEEFRVDNCIYDIQCVQPPFSSASVIVQSFKRDKNMIPEDKIEEQQLGGAPIEKEQHTKVVDYTSWNVRDIRRPGVEDLSMNEDKDIHNPQSQSQSRTKTNSNSKVKANTKANTTKANTNSKLGTGLNKFLKKET